MNNERTLMNKRQNGTQQRLYVTKLKFNQNVQDVHSLAEVKLEKEVEWEVG